MHGRTFLIATMLAALLVGCTDVSEPTPTAIEAETSLGRAFDKNATGTIRGAVTWGENGPIAEATLVRTVAFNPHFFKDPLWVLTPNIPKIQANTRGVENAIVYLRNVDAGRSRPWDHAPVLVEFKDRKLVVVHNEQPSGVGIVRRGAAVGIVNRETEYHNLHARGAAFFAQPLVEANKMHERILSKAGVVELSCAAGYYWLNAHLHVADHPYYARTRADGTFTLEQVPTGTYELVCWLPSWHVARKEVDPETAIIARYAWETPREQVQTVQVDAGQVREVSYQWMNRMFRSD